MLDFDFVSAAEILRKNHEVYTLGPTDRAVTYYYFFHKTCKKQALVQSMVFLQYKEHEGLTTCSGFWSLLPLLEALECFEDVFSLSLFGELPLVFSPWGWPQKG